jgi:transcription elongation GreA/GreB family factor
MTFTMRPSTEREGDLKVGSTVTVRYQDTADHRLATIVAVEHAKLPPHASPSHS